MSNMTKYAEQELIKAGWTDKESDYGGKVAPAVIHMVAEFARQGHSGMSAHICTGLFERLIRFRPLTPLDNPFITGEYNDVSEYSGKPAGTDLQGTRLSSLFSHDGGKTWYDLDKPLSWLRRKVLRQRRAYVSFPYMPA